MAWKTVGKMPGMSQPSMKSTTGTSLPWKGLQPKQQRLLAALGKLRRAGVMGHQDTPRTLLHFGGLAHRWAPGAKQSAPPSLQPPVPAKLPNPQPASARQTLPPGASKLMALFPPKK
jgi:hypothetical protein